MLPASESTKLEGEGTFVEYTGSGKLKDKKVLVTGGEYVIQCICGKFPVIDYNLALVSVGLWPY